MSERTSYEIISTYVTSPIRKSMLNVPIEKRNALSEIRIRSGRPVTFIYRGYIKFLMKNGELTSYSDNADCITASAEEIAEIINALCRYSMHSCSKELREGYFVINGGIRVGAAGTSTETSGGILRDFNALNFRIAREVIGCAEELYNKICNSGGSVLICGGVNSGKTTMLRDLCRLCGRRFKVSLIDERNEISAAVSGQPCMDVGVMTDVLVGTKRSHGIISAVRTLSPDMIFCDEISTVEDSEAILSGFGCGVRFVSTIHAENYSDMLKRSIVQPLVSARVFDYAVFLGRADGSYGIKEIRRLKNDD